MHGKSADIKRLETDVEGEVSELRKAQDALSKTMERHRLDLNLMDREIDDLMCAGSRVQHKGFSCISIQTKKVQVG